MGLDESYSTIRTQITNIEPLYDINKVYVMITQEESHRSVVQAHENSAAFGFVVQSNTLHPIKAQSSSSSPSLSDRPFCIYCQCQGHTYDWCWTRLSISPSQNKGRGHGYGHRTSRPIKPHLFHLLLQSKLLHLSMHLQ